MKNAVTQPMSVLRFFGCGISTASWARLASKASRSSTFGRGEPANPVSAATTAPVQCGPAAAAPARFRDLRAGWLMPRLRERNPGFEYNARYSEPRMFCIVVISFCWLVTIDCAIAVAGEY